MVHVLVITQAVLLLLVMLIAGLLFVTIRQVGVLYERIGPFGALTLPHALGPGEHTPSLQVMQYGGEGVTIGGPREPLKPQLLVFISPTCPMCKRILKLLPSFARTESSRFDIILVGDGPANPYIDMLRQYGLEDLTLVLDGSVGITYRVGKLPYAVLIDSAGVLRSAGLVNNREHLESLTTAYESGISSMEAYLGAAAKADGARRWKVNPA